MGCCGSRRAALTAHTNNGSGDLPMAAPRTTSPAIHSPTRANRAVLTLRYLQRGTLALRGPRTGSVYHVSDAGPVAVHPDDAPALLRTGLFARADREDR